MNSLNSYVQLFAGLAATALAVLSPAAWAQSGDGSLDDAVPVVLTPSRMRQALADSPSAVTVISADTLERWAVTSVMDALALVPGMAVMRTEGGEWRVAYHGTRFSSPRRLNVLVDGVSVYQPAFARIEWASLPVGIEDIERIEVIRGPASATFGPNSMMAVVNIITKHPKDVDRVQVSLLKGDRARTDATVRLASTWGGTAWSLSASDQRDGGYDFNSRLRADHDSTAFRRLALSTQTDFASHSRLSGRLTVWEGDREVPFVDSTQASSPDMRIAGALASLDWSRELSADHRISVKAAGFRTSTLQSWKTCPPAYVWMPELFGLWRSNPAYVSSVLKGALPAGASGNDLVLAQAAIARIKALGSGATQPVCATADHDQIEQRIEVEATDVVVLSPSTRLVSGFGVRQSSGLSPTYYNGTSKIDMRWLFASLEHRPWKDLTVNASGFLQDDAIAGTTFSPRLTFNLRVSEFGTLRSGMSFGTRSPDVLEQRANWTYEVFDADPHPLTRDGYAKFYQSVVAAGGLKSEKNRLFEIAYLHLNPALGLQADVRVFEEVMTSLVSENLTVASFLPTNNTRNQLSGAEVQVDWGMGSAVHVFGRAAYLHNPIASNSAEKALYSRWSGALGASWRSGDGWRGSAAYVSAKGDAVRQISYGRLDLSLGRAMSWGSSRGSWTLMLRRLDNVIAPLLPSTYRSREEVLAKLQWAL